VTTAEFEDLRRRAFGIAYRMLGSVSEAEDVVQEALLRMHRAQEQGEEIRSPRAYISTLVTRLAIDELRSARARRETYVGEWLPEPIVGPAPDDPAAEAELADSLSMAFLQMLERLTPEQRAAFLLHDVFGYSFDEVARVLERNEASVRKLASRARSRVTEGAPRYEVEREEQQRLAERFLAAARRGEVKELEAMLTEDVELHGDGGGEAPALARPLFGRSRVARTLTAWLGLVQDAPGIEIEITTVNGHAGAITRDENGAVISVLSLDVADGRIQAIRSIVNPRKLAHLGPSANLADVLARVREVRARMHEARRRERARKPE
jgi:RNA polymerase sigma-70 factor (ECF subfamily)